MTMIESVQDVENDDQQDKDEDIEMANVVSNGHAHSDGDKNGQIISNGHKDQKNGDAISNGHH